MTLNHAPVTMQPPTLEALEELPPGEPAGRLVVVVPDVAEAAVLAGRIREVARATGRDVLIVGVASQSLSEDELRRRLSLLVAFLRDAGTTAQVRIEQGLDWVPQFRSLLRDNDMLACSTIAGPPGSGGRWIETLGTRFQRPVYAFADSSMAKPPQRRLVARLAPWVGAVAIIYGFFRLQIWLSQTSTGPATTGWLFVSIPVEIGLIWLFNSLLG